LKLKNIAIVLACVLFVAGCSSLYRRPTVTREVPGITRGAHLNKVEIISYLENQPKLNGFRAKGKISIRTSKWSGSGRVFVAGAYPEKLHFEVFDFFGNPKWIINATPQKVEALNVASRELYVSKNTRELMEGLFAIPADLDEIFFFFTGQSPPVNWSNASLSVLDNDKYLLLETTSNVMDNWLLYLNDVDLRIHKAIIWHRKDHSKLKIKFDDFNHADNYFIPYDRVLSVRNAQMEIKYKKFIVDKATEDNLFRLKKLNNTRVIKVGQLVATPPNSRRN